MSTWLTPPYYTPPAPMPEYYLDGPFVNVRFSIEYGMGLSIDGDLKDPNNKFNNNPALDPQYQDPISYARNKVAFAQDLANNPKYYKPVGWDPTEAGLRYANIVFGLLLQIPCNRGDEHSNNLFNSWAAGTGQFYGGHAPVQANAGDGTNPATGPSAVQAGSIFGGNKQ